MRETLEKIRAEIEDAKDRLHPTWSGEARAQYDAFSWCISLIDKYAEQEPKTGHWIEHPEIETSKPEYLMFYECSECGDEQCFCKPDIRNNKKRFCSNCGAEMKGGAE